MIGLLIKFARPINFGFEFITHIDFLFFFFFHTTSHPFFVIATKNVGNKNIGDIEKNGKYSTINGKQGVIKKAELRPLWDIKKSKFIGYYDDVQFSYVENGQYICVATTDEAYLKDVIK